MKIMFLRFILFLQIGVLVFLPESRAQNNKGKYDTRIGTIIQAEIIPSLTGARDIGGCIVTKSGRIVIAAGVSDIKQNHPFKIAITDDGGKTVKEVFDMQPETPEVTYHTVGITYNPELDLIVSFFGRTNGLKIFDWEKYETVPWSYEKSGTNDAFLALSWDNGETWHIDKKIRLEKPEYTSGMIGSGVIQNGVFYFPHSVSTSNENKTERRLAVYLARYEPIKTKDGFTGNLDIKYRTLSSSSKIDIRYSDETVYIEKLDGTGYISFTRSQPGPPYRREYDLNHYPTNEFERIQTVGFDPDDYDHGHNGPLLIAFGIVRLADGNLLYASRYYGTKHHRAGNIFMTSTDEGKTWEFHEDNYIPWTLDPLTFPNIGSGGNPEIYYKPDGSLVHITSQGWQLGKDGTYRHPSPGGFALCTFKGIDISLDTPGKITVDVSTITKLKKVFISKISVTESKGVEMPDETTERYSYSSDLTKVSFPYKKTGDNAFIKLEIVLANESNGYRPVFTPIIKIN